MQERVDNYYGGKEDLNEAEFLQTQMKLMKSLDDPIYEKIGNLKNGDCILDVGCNDGKQIIQRFGIGDKFKLVGVDREVSCIETAKQDYPKGIWGCFDIEGENFAQDFKKFNEEHNIIEYDLICISMVILHLKNPLKLLKVLHSCLSKKGVIFIRDIDDGLNQVYPDKDGIFARLTRLCEHCDMLGNRNSGREIYTLLCSAGYQQIALEKIGFSTVGMTKEEKYAFFDVYFGYVPIALEKTFNRTKLENVKKDFEWASGIMEKAKKQFLEDDFYFNLGYMIWTARK